MATCTPFNKMFFNTPSGTQSETPSEISSVDSDWSDIRTIALKLGVLNPDELLTERFKVDRQKLENMIKVESTVEDMNSAEEFFDNIMKNTKTYISWPCRLKIGARTKKDPHVRIVGKPEDVQQAKEKILSQLDSRGTRVIMKMDVPYTDHSYIIGRGGSNIKKIMEETSTHIHFPDSNRSNPTEKSNQVSLCGSLEGVERARSQVRLSAPLLISFELPIMAPGKSVPDHDTPYIKEIESLYNVQVIFSTRPKLHSSLVLVKGSEKDAVKVQKATQLLINFTCENIASQILVQMQLEISPQHHEIVKGKSSINLLHIMERTRTKIIFPDINDVNIKQIKKSQVTITGTIEDVYKARQQLIGNLPIALIFDYPEIQPDTSEIVNLGHKYGVFIIFRQKQRQNTMVVVVKGVEKYIGKIYEARREILKLNTNNVIPEIPATYFSSKDNENEQIYRFNLSSLLANYPESPLTPLLPLTHGLTSYNNLNPYQKYHLTQTGFSPLNSKNLLPIPHNIYRVSCDKNNSKNVNSNYLPLSISQNLSPRNNSNNTSGYQSFSSSTNSLEQNYLSFNNVPPSSTKTNYSPDSTFVQDVKNRRMSDGNIVQNISSDTNDCRNRSYDIKQQKQQHMFDFDIKRVCGYKAMERAPQGEIRTPNANWIGLGLSRTSPVPLESTNDTSWNNYNNHLPSPYNLGATTGIVDSTPSNRRANLSQYKDIHSLLTSLGLEHYIKTFVLNEIDLEMFTTLTEENLIELGITAFGARKRLLMAINSILAECTNNFTVPINNYQNQNASQKFSGSAAPGAERRTSNGW